MQSVACFSRRRKALALHGPLLGLCLLMAASLQPSLSETLRIKRTECYANEHYFVIDVAEGNDSRNIRQIVRHKSNPSETFACIDKTREGDFEPQGDKRPYVYRDLRSHFLILQGGIRTHQDLDVYDLRTGERILSKSYYSREGQQISDTDVRFWMEDAVPLPGTCAKNGKGIESDTMAVTEREVVFDFGTRTLKPILTKGGKAQSTRCFEVSRDML
jgi:hypothetical protein